ncbi:MULTISPECIES: LysR substrate-binding domain-containing protein [unclassified Halomonas]|uniref:LysR substrate-binding domain-containing protein n=1 Tax=unclassified Halomonas TaxID=2609666 RepID=UPI002076B6F1|nr:LysR substrate-binding domain-containing protein [Halomonas sp. S3-1-8]
MLPTLDSELLRTFIAIVDQGSFTRAANAVNRTQSAVSMQMKRLEEDIIQRPLFVRASKPLTLTSEGQTLLRYARRILDLQSEALNTLRQPDMVGRVRLGVPDDYVMRFLPGILKSFARAWPLVDVDVQCAPSSVLLQQPTEELDMRIVTREIGDEIGTVLRRESTVWVAAASHSVHLASPVPLAMFDAPCACRRHACNALDREGRPYRIAYSSPSLATLQAVVSEGLAVSAWMQSLVTEDMQILGDDLFPTLPEVSIVLVRSTSAHSPIIDSLAEHIQEGFRL